MATKLINLKLLVDKDNNRLVYAESDEDFVDILLSFLTLPMGAIIKLVEKQSQIGCMDALYESVENLDVKYLQSEGCKSMLLNPKKEWPSHSICKDLCIAIDHEDRDAYICPTWTCTNRLVSLFKNVKCTCGKKMDRKFRIVDNEGSEGFVKGMKKFMIGDNLNITVVSTTASLTLLRQLGITDLEALVEEDVSVGREEVLHLLKRSLVSKTPMEDVFLKKCEEELEHPTFHVKLEPLDVDVKQSESKNISLKLLLSKSKNKVLYAEAKEDFLDFLFSFLSFPLGSILKLLEGCSSIGSIDNLYKCVLPLCNDDNALLGSRKELLLNPKVAFHYGIPCGIKNLLLGIEESHPFKINVLECSTCFDEKKQSCLHGLGKTKTGLINPKTLDPTVENEGGYVKGPNTFMVTDDLVVKPFSPISSMFLVKKLGVPFFDLEEKIVRIGEQEALALLNVSLRSKNVFSQVFCQNQRKQLG